MNGLQLHLNCPTREESFDSGIQIARAAVARIAHITVRLRCPVCYDMHTLMEKGDLVER